MAFVGTVSLFAAFAVIVIWHTYSDLPPDLESVRPAKPYIAVLPFVNLSGDPNQKYFSDGLAINIITQLYKMPNVFVISHQSSFKYRGKAVKVQQVGRELGVRYVLEGSVERSGNHIRMNVQLIDAGTGGHLWAERFDRELKDVFAVQDEIIRKVVGEIAVETAWGEMGRLVTHATENYEALDCFLKATALWQRFEKESNAQARELLLKAINLDPKYAMAITLLAATHRADAKLGWAKDPDRAYMQARETVERALNVDETCSIAHVTLGCIYEDNRHYEQAIAAKKRGIEYEPNNGLWMSALAETMNFVGRPEEALVLTRKAMRLCPYPPPFFHSQAGVSNYLTGRYEAAISEFQHYINRLKPGATPRPVFWAWLIASYMELRRESEARVEARKLLEQHPSFCIETYIKLTKTVLPFRDYAYLDHQIELLRKAGLK